VEQWPATLLPGSQISWKLADDVKLNLGSGYKRLLKKGTIWNCIGKIEQGDVLRTDDQVLTVEASNVFEAYIVVSGGLINGFYLPVERTYSPLPSPEAIRIEKF